MDPGQSPTSTEEWLSLLQKQEMVHQMELEKWHEMLGAATELLRKVRWESGIVAIRYCEKSLIVKI